MNVPVASADALHCEAVVREHARTFALASRLLPLEKRRAAYALYAFCRLADDMVDSAPADRRSITAAQLDAYREQLDRAIAGNGEGPVFREVARVVGAFNVPGEPLHELLQGVARDLSQPRYATWSELELYCEGVASSVGEMCTHVFGVPGGESKRLEAVRYARTLGVAMQLTNILRDVGEDAHRGRCYLPAEDLALFDLTPADVLRGDHLAEDERWRHLMVFEIARARSLYRVARPGISLLASDAQSCATACATGYARILDAIEQQHYDTISSRARVSKLARLGILWDAWRLRPVSRTTPIVNGTGLFWEERPNGPPYPQAGPA
ncbi:MAG: phytoene/squalene synthase family protein [Gemmatimonas sp.]